MGNEQGKRGEVFQLAVVVGVLVGVGGLAIRARWAGEAAEQAARRAHTTTSSSTTTSTTVPVSEMAVARAAGARRRTGA